MVTLNSIFLISFIQEIILIFQLKLYIKIPREISYEITLFSHSEEERCAWDQ